MYQKILNDITTIAQTVPKITLISLIGDNICEVETKTLLKVTKIAFGALESGGFRWTAVSSAQLISAICAEAERGFDNNFVSLKYNSENNHMVFWNASRFLVLL